MTDKPFDMKAFLEGGQDYAEVDPDGLNDAEHLLINWGKKSTGFGQLAFQIRDGVLHLDNETMGRDFCAWVLDKLTETMSYGDLPPLVRRYQTIDALLDDCVPHWPWEKP